MQQDGDGKGGQATVLVTTDVPIMSMSLAVDERDPVEQGVAEGGQDKQRRGKHLPPPTPERRPLSGVEPMEQRRDENPDTGHRQHEHAAQENGLRQDVQNDESGDRDDDEGIDAGRQPAVTPQRRPEQRTDGQGAEAEHDGEHARTLQKACAAGNGRAGRGAAGDDRAARLLAARPSATMRPMLLADVTGTVVMTVKHPAFDGEKLLAVQPLDENLRPVGTTILAIDRAQAGVGDRVLVLREGSGVRQIVGRDQGKPVDQAVKMDWPVRSMIVAIVDSVDVDRGAAGRKAGGA
jgi:microcompartment protein CcmK/EutM